MQIIEFIIRTNNCHENIIINNLHVCISSFKSNLSVGAYIYSCTLSEVKIIILVVYRLCNILKNLYITDVLICKVLKVF